MRYDWVAMKARYHSSVVEVTSRPRGPAYDTPGEDAGLDPAAFFDLKAVRFGQMRASCCWCRLQESCARSGTVHTSPKQTGTHRRDPETECT